jgi:hypothetical protein
MSGDRALVQHRCETMARLLAQLRAGSEAALHHVTIMLAWWDEAATLEQGDAVREAIEKTRAALVAVQIDLESVTFAMESAQLRASATARLVAGYTTLYGADHEK